MDILRLEKAALLLYLVERKIIGDFDESDRLVDSIHPGV